MINYELPTSVEIDGREYEIRTDFRAALDICAALVDPELSDDERYIAALFIFYPEFPDMPQEHYAEAMKRCAWFIDGGENYGQRRSGPRLMDWEQDFSQIVAPINRVMGQDIRGLDTLHWWTFLAAYYEIGDCTFAQIVRIRDLKARGKPLSAEERRWYNNNRDLVDLKTRYTEKDKETEKMWFGQ